MLDHIKSAYFIGIKGVGMTALAQIFKEKYKVKVIGSDTDEEFFTDKVLRSHRIKFCNGFNVKNLSSQVGTRRGAFLVIISSAYNEQNNIEVKQAKKLGLKIIKYSEGLSMLFKNNFGIAICGSHGKTTTTAMLGYVLKKAGLDPTVIVGSNVPQFKGNALSGKSKYLVVEADEYQAKILEYQPQAIIITNIDYDHPDFFKNEKAYKQVFWKFIKKLPKNGILVVNVDDGNVKDLVKKVKQQKLRIKILEYSAVFPPFAKGARGIFSASNGISLKLPGTHNISNALAVFTLAKHFDIPEKQIIKYLNEFKGTTRRFEHKGKYRRAIVIDDYAHHPTEIKATLKAAREKYPEKRIWCVFHPHTFSRTQALFDDFAKSFHDADKTIILDIYGSARETKGNGHFNRRRGDSKDLVSAINKNNSDALYLPTKEDTAKYLRNRLGDKDILITMGAGDVWKIGEKLLKN